MKRVRFSNITNNQLFSGLAGSIRRGSSRTTIPTPLSGEILEMDREIEAVPRTRRIVFSSGARLFAAARLKKIKIKFVLGKRE